MVWGSVEWHMAHENRRLVVLAGSTFLSQCVLLVVGELHVLSVSESICDRGAKKTHNEKPDYVANSMNDDRRVVANVLVLLIGADVLPQR